MKKNNHTRVMVTGLGVASTLGNNVETFWENLNLGVSGLQHQPKLEDKGTPFRVGGVITELEELNRSANSPLDRATQLALKAATQAVNDAHIKVADDIKVAVVMGTTCGANDVIETEGFEENWYAGNLTKCPNHSFEKYHHEAIANEISRKFGFYGPSYVVGTACASGNHAIGEAADLIRTGQADIVICGGADAFTLLPVFGFYSMKTLADKQCTPFDRNRKGMLLGEGAAVLVLESYQSAKKRGLPPLAELQSWSLNCDAQNFASPLEDGERCKELIQSCLSDVNLNPEDVDYINLHGTGTKVNDLMEARGVAKVYGKSLTSVFVSSTKGMLGHTLGAAGAFDGLTAVLAIANNRIPPNTPIEKMDEGVKLNIVTESTSVPVNKVLSISFAFGGCNVASLFSKP